MLSLPVAFLGIMLSQAAPSRAVLYPDFIGLNDWEDYSLSRAADPDLSLYDWIVKRNEESTLLTIAEVYWASALLGAIFFEHRWGSYALLAPVTPIAALGARGVALGVSAMAWGVSLIFVDLLDIGSVPFVEKSQSALAHHASTARAATPTDILNSAQVDLP